ncbi:hypothetical protein ACI3ER_11295 [Bacillus sp. Wb]
MRVVKVKENGKWKRIKFKELYNGAEFKLYKFLFIPVKNSLGDAVFHATSDAFYDRDMKRYIIDTEE